MTDDFAARLRASVQSQPVRSTLDPDDVLHASLRTQTRRTFGTAGVAVAACAVMGAAIAVPGGLFDQTTESAPAAATLGGDVLRAGEQPVLVDVDGVVATDKAVGSELSDGTVVLDLGLDSWVGTDERFVVTFPADDQQFPNLEVWSTDAAGLEQLYERGRADSAGLGGMTRISDNQGAFVMLVSPDGAESVIVGGIGPADEVGLRIWDGVGTPEWDTTRDFEEFEAFQQQLYAESLPIPTVRDPYGFYDISVFAAALGEAQVDDVVAIRKGTGHGIWGCDGPCDALTLGTDGTVTSDQPDLDVLLASAVLTPDLEEQALRADVAATRGATLHAECAAPFGTQLEAVVSVDGVESSRTEVPCTGAPVRVLLADLVGDVTVTLDGELDAVREASARLVG
ncbi:hypothetical protein [Paraoerskovia marina]|uniref:hypothetical protein n=1 Tax=Paraoerskovia marina TaxID=545619 RepID=UPI0004928D30|nr:hypothetical protein [Paraoerskovia marina]